MQHINMQRNSHRQPHLNTHAAIMSLTLTIAFLSGCLLLGCGGGGNGDGNGNPRRRVFDSQTGTFIGAPNSETAEALPFTFSDGAVFHADLAGDVVTVTLDSVTDTVIMITLLSDGHMARGEVVLDNCNFGSVLQDPVCLYPVTITSSDFDLGAGPQVAEVLMLEDWRLVARTEVGSDQLVVTLGVEGETGPAVISEFLEVDGQRLCPWVCVGS